MNVNAFSRFWVVKLNFSQMCKRKIDYRPFSELKLIYLYIFNFFFFVRWIVSKFILFTCRYLDSYRHWWLNSLNIFKSSDWTAHHFVFNQFHFRISYSCKWCKWYRSKNWTLRSIIIFRKKKKSFCICVWDDYYSLFKVQPIDIELLNSADSSVLKLDILNWIWILLLCCRAYAVHKSIFQFQINFILCC